MSLHIEKLDQTFSHDKLVAEEMRKLDKCLRKIDNAKQNNEKHIFCENVGFSTRYFLTLRNYNFDKKSDGIHINLK